MTLQLVTPFGGQVVKVRVYLMVAVGSIPLQVVLLQPGTLTQFHTMGL